MLKIDSDIDISSGEYALDSLTYSVLNEGIIGIKVTIDSTDYWAYEVKLKNVKRLNNPYYLPDYEVFYYIQNNKIYFKVGDGLSLTGATANIYLIKIPDEITEYADSPVSDVVSNLTADLYELLVTMAEYYCWEMEGNFERANAIKKLSLMEIQTMNYKFTASPDIVIGE